MTLAKFYLMIILVSIVLIAIGCLNVKPDIVEYPHLLSSGKIGAPVVQDNKQDLTPKKLVFAIKKKYPHVATKEAERVVKYAFKYGQENGIDPVIVLGIIGVESSFKRKAVSPYGAVGYMQVVPRFHKEKIKGKTITDTNTNIRVGAEVFGKCLKSRKTENGAYACYSGNRSNYAAAKYKAKVKKNKRQLVMLASL